jgi:hypothetical protein
MQGPQSPVREINLDLGELRHHVDEDRAAMWLEGGIVC